MQQLTANLKGALPMLFIPFVGLITTLLYYYIQQYNTITIKKLNQPTELSVCG
jgi:hypothetical protein